METCRKIALCVFWGNIDFYSKYFIYFAKTYLARPRKNTAIIESTKIYDKTESTSLDIHGEESVP